MSLQNLIKGKTALQKAQEVRSGGTSSTVRVAFSILMGVLIAVIAIFAHQLLVISLEKGNLSSLREQAVVVEGEVSQQLNEFNQTVDVIAREAKNLIALNAGPDAIALRNQELSEQYPELKQVMITSVQLTEIMSGDTVDSGFATWDRLLRLIETGILPYPEVLLIGKPEAKIEFVRKIINPENKQLAGFLVVSFPVSELLNIISSDSADSDVFNLMQGISGDSDRILKSFGSDQQLLEKQQSYSIPNSNFFLTYAVKPKFSLLQTRNSWFCLLILIIAIALLFVLFFSKRQLGLLSNSEIKELVEEENDLLASEKTNNEGSPLTATSMKDNSTVVEKTEEKPAAKKLVKLSASIFKKYDIRGIVGETLTEDVTILIGKAIGSTAIELGHGEIVIARDGRVSSPQLSDALLKGLTSTGINVIDIGAAPTPVLYFATHQMETHAGVMITGSHNPSNYNGFKIVLDGQALSGDKITALYERIAKKAFKTGTGGVQQSDIIDDYINYISNDIQLEKPIKVVVDAGNGIAGAVAPKLLEALGASVIPLNCEVDGRFPNHHPDPSQPENLAELISSVRALKADLGIAFDGDGDRLGAITGDGDIIYPDRLLMLFAEDVLIRNPGGTIIYDVKCTGALANIIVGHGGTPLMWKTGHSLIKAKMQETQAVLAGEMSGHFFFKERWFGFDDGIYAAARLLELLAYDERGISEIFSTLPKAISTPELRLNMAESEPMKFMEKFVASVKFEDARIITIDGIRADFTDGWGLIRCSNTTPSLIMRFEANDEEVLQRIQQEFKQQILQVDSELTLPF